MTRRTCIRLLAFSAVAFSSLAGYWLWDHRGYWLADNLREVEPGRIYAGGYQYARPLERIIRRYGIKTVLSLREGGDPFESDERAVLETNGVQFRKIVIPYRVSDEERIAAIEQAIALITEEQNQPVYVHCWAGCHRTGAVVAIYRVSRCNWSESAAREELVSWGGTARGTQWPTRVLHTYCTRSGESVARHPQGDPVR
jgi:protein-tyrosine phosphatase